MASNRKKLDEKHLKILRNLVSLSGNKQCFDCNQRGPTYVNMTIGSFVCTSCSGLLRGLTPPHRVKSISMATFTPEEIESVQSRGNEYCRKVWLALYDSNHIHDTKDELLVKEFMIAKYEKKRYYVEPSLALRNGNSHSPTPALSPAGGCDNYKTQYPIVPNSSLTVSQSPPAISLQPNSKSSQTQSSNAFKSSVSAFDLTDPFGPVTNSSQKQQQQQQQQQSFANFDNNPIFNSTMTSSASFPSAKSQAPSEDKYAALKDLDFLMKMQQQESQSQNQPVQANGWPCGGISGSNPLNPFQADIENSNVHNPFVSGLVFQTEKINSDVNKNGNVNGNGSSNHFSSPWTVNPWGNNTAPNSTFSAAFPATNWSPKGNMTQVIPGNSSNPFL